MKITAVPRLLDTLEFLPELTAVSHLRRLSFENEKEEENRIWVKENQEESTEFRHCHGKESRKQNLRSGLVELKHYSLSPIRNPSELLCRKWSKAVSLGCSLHHLFLYYVQIGIFDRQVCRMQRHFKIPVHGKELLLM